MILPYATERMLFSTFSEQFSSQNEIVLVSKRRRKRKRKRVNLILAWQLCDHIQEITIRPQKSQLKKIATECGDIEMMMRLSEKEKESAIEGERKGIDNSSTLFIILPHFMLNDVIS